MNVAAKGRTPGLQGGTLNTMVTRSKDIRQMVVYGYARLVGYNETYDLVPDILESFENEGDRKFTLNLREGHKWSSGDPFTSADFEYWWKHIANNEELNPTGPPDFVRVEGSCQKSHSQTQPQWCLSGASPIRAFFRCWRRRCRPSSTALLPT